MKKKINVVIFAAGKGVRMNFLTNYCPKPLIPVFGQPILERTISFLVKEKIEEINIVVGYLSEQFNYLQEKFPSVKINLIKNKYFDEYNNISSLFVSHQKFANTLYIEGDIYLKDENILRKVINKIAANNYQATMFGSKSPINKLEWVFNLKNNKVVDHTLEQKTKDKFIWTGLYFVDQKMAKEISQKIDFFFKNKSNQQIYAEQFLWMLDQKFTFANIPHTSFVEIDTMEDLMKFDKSYKSHNHKTIFTPGPINVFPELTEVLSQSVLHHRSELIRYYMKKLTTNLKELFMTKNGTPLIVTSSTTGLMEASVSNLVSPGQEVLLINIGDFGQRFREILDIYQAKVTELKYPKSQSSKLEDIENALKKQKFHAIFITYIETSTGVLQDLGALAKLLDKLFPNDADRPLLIADSVSAVAQEELKFDEWKLDAAFASTSKAFGLPPGLSTICLSQRALKEIYQSTNKRFYFDLRKYDSQYKLNNESPFTPAVSLIMAWNASVDIILRIGIKNIYKQKLEMFEYLNVELTKLGFENLIKKENQTPSILVAKVPEGLDAVHMKNYLDTKYDIFIEIGRGEEGGDLVRLGISNTINFKDVKNLIIQIKKYIGRSNEN